MIRSWYQRSLARLRHSWTLSAEASARTRFSASRPSPVAPVDSPGPTSAQESLSQRPARDRVAGPRSIASVACSICAVAIADRRRQLVALGLEHALPGSRRAGGESPERCCERPQRLQLDLGVAATGEQPAGVPVAAVLGLEASSCRARRGPAAAGRAASSGLCGRRGSRRRARLARPPSSRSSAFSARPRAIRRSSLARALLGLQAEGARRHGSLLPFPPGSGAAHRRERGSGLRSARSPVTSSPEPRRRPEALALPLGAELDLGRDQARQLPVVDVDLGFEPALRAAPGGGSCAAAATRSAARAPRTTRRRADLDLLARPRRAPA